MCVWRLYEGRSRQLGLTIATRLLCVEWRKMPTPVYERRVGAVSVVVVIVDLQEKKETFAAAC